MADGSNGSLIGQYTATKEQLDEYAHGDTEEQDILVGREKQREIASRESDYQKRRFDRQLDGSEGESFKDVMRRRELEREEDRVQKLVTEKQKEESNGVDGEHKALLADGANGEAPVNGDGAVVKSRKKRRRWDTSTEGTDEDKPATNGENVDVDMADTQPAVKKSKWDTAAPVENGLPAGGTVSRRSRFDMAPSLAGATPAANSGLATPLHPSQNPTTGFGTDVSSRNAAISDEELDAILPSEGYKILPFPPGYEPLIRAPTHKVSSTPASLQGGFMMQQSVDPRSMGKDLSSDVTGLGDLRMKAEDMQYFGKLVDGSDENELSVDELKERKIMRLLIKVKNGTPPMRKTALRQLTDNARSFGAGPLFDQILPLLMEKSLEDQERHLLVKVIDRILYKLDDLVRPYTHKILVVIEPLLIDQDYYARVEGREIISNLAKAAGLAHMISTMRPDIDHADEYVRNTTARAFAVVASALGIPALLPFLRAVCRSKKSWQARHTGVKIVQQIPILMGCAVLPHLKGLVDCIADNLQDEQAKVRTVTALSIAALAEASNPYGIESFEDILNPLWQGARYVYSLSYIVHY